MVYVTASPPRKLAVVTGAGPGLTGATGRKFLDEEWNLVTIDRKPACPEVFHGYKLADGQVHVHFEVDLLNEKEVERITRKILEIDVPSVIVNGVHRSPGDDALDMIQTTADVYAEAWTGTAVPGYHLTRSLLPHMIDAGRGRVINISSVNAIWSCFGNGPYTDGKLALEQQARSINVRHARQGVTAFAPQFDWLASSATKGNLDRQTKYPNAPLFMAATRADGRLMTHHEGADIVFFAAVHLPDVFVVSQTVFPLDGGRSGLGPFYGWEFNYRETAERYGAAISLERELNEMPVPQLTTRQEPKGVLARLNAFLMAFLP